MAIDDTGDNVYALLFEPVRVFQHLIRFSDPWRSADVDTKVGSLMLLELCEKQRFCRWTLYICHVVIAAKAFVQQPSDQETRHAFRLLRIRCLAPIGIALWTSVNRFSQNSRSFSIPPHCAPNDKLRDAQRAE
jgi:hypothetical protein